jgi:hypothetical protein
MKGRRLPVRPRHTPLSYLASVEARLILTPGGSPDHGSVT